MVIRSKQKLLILIFLLCLIPLSVVLIVKNWNQKNDYSAAKDYSAREKIKLAVCPTYYAEAEKLGKDIFSIIKTGSTAESLALLNSGQAGYILAGRTLKSGEGDYEALVLGQGYSFLAGREAVISENDLKTMEFFTDLPIDEIIENFGIINITRVEDVYEYADQGIVITSWENTDYGRSDIVHVTSENGARVKLSRRPVLYCAEACDRTAADMVKKQFN